VSESASQSLETHQARETRETREALEAAAEHMETLLATARRRIWLQTRCRVLNDLPETHLAQHLSRVARRTRHADLRILIDDDLALKRTQPRLVQTVSRLSSSISVRCYAPEQDTPGTLLVVVDRHSWLYLVQHRAQVGLRSEDNDPPGTHSAAEKFEDEWAISTEALELRRLSI
jgi:hypothetical protein